MKKSLLTMNTLLAVLLLLATGCNEKTPATDADTPPLVNAVVPRATLTNAQQVQDCNFDKGANWWTATAAGLPASVANNPVTGAPEFCEFYQFAQDWYLYLISPSTLSAGLPNFEDGKQFPLLETAGTNSCDEELPAHAFNVRTAKSAKDGLPFVLPERIDQAGANAIYDRNGNIAFYEIRFSRNLCDYQAIQAKANFPGKTVEIKISWKVLAGDDQAGDYFQTSAVIAGKPYNLGLIGMHVVVSADNHPEMVWTTIEHKTNAIVCKNIAPGQSAFAFTKAACAQDKNNCVGLNTTIDSAALSIDPQKATDICVEYPYGTQEGQPIETKDGLNVALIDKLNASLQALLAQPGVPASLAPWQNYRVMGALWISDINKDSSDATNQRGSLLLANPVMETSFQGTSGTTLNCFICHNYSATSSNTAANTLSHIIDDIVCGIDPGNSACKK